MGDITVSSIPDEELLRRAVASAKPRRDKPKWDAVADRFALGKFFADWDGDGLDGWLPILIIHRDGLEPVRLSLLPFYHKWLDRSVTQ